MKAKSSIRIKFTVEELQSMSTPALRTLRAQAADRGVTETVAMIDVILGDRPLRAGGRFASKYASVLRQLDDAMVRVQAELHARYDLSPERAGTVHAHSVFGKGGGVKCGGDAMAGTVAYDHYVSYRSGDVIAYLSVTVRSTGDVPVVTAGIDGNKREYSLSQFDEAAAHYAAVVGELCAGITA